MSDFRIFCELLVKTMLESIDFTDVLEGYRRNEKPEILGIATSPIILASRPVNLVEMKSPRYWALQLFPPYNLIETFSRNEKPEILGIATYQDR